MINENWFGAFYVVSILGSIVAFFTVPTALFLQLIMAILLLTIAIYLYGIHEEAMQVRKIIEESEKE